MAEPTTYTGSCHCGAVRFEAKLELGTVMACNCSMCQRKGSLLTFVPATQFKRLTPNAPLTDYQFNKMHIHHLFCPTCGMHAFAQAAGKDGTPMVAINVRCLEGVDVSTLTVNHFNGRDI